MLKYIAAANALEKTLHDTVLPELVAEARGGGVQWAAIGKALGISTRAAHNKYGSLELPDRGTLPAMEDEVVGLTNEVSGGFPGDSPILSQISEVVGESTPQERVRYAVKMMRGAAKSYREVLDEIARPSAEYDNGRFNNAIYDAHQKLTVAALTMLSDPGQWTAVRGWAEPSGSVDASHYHDPVMYIFYAMRLLMLASNYHGMALNPELDFEEKVQLFQMTSDILEQSMTVMMRKDASSVIYKVLRED